ncbi:membrane protein [Streptomyces cirratus]|uniref:Membrane protein n=1 Tax=Streptomyces cirratus TaxID=68187 RepID=A0ABQ3ERR8_9ACTN|nr:membrane protein [Streptomyces cirratus]
MWGSPAAPLPPALNGFAVASLPVGLLCLPPLGVVFAVVALVQIARRGDRGKALAVVGLVVSLVMSAALVYATGRYADPFFRRLGSAGGRPYVEGRLTDMNALRPGDCFNVPGGDLLGGRAVAYRTACTGVHHAEVTSSGPMADGAYPGAERLKEQATAACWKAQDEYAMDSWAVPGYAEMFYFAPSREAWGLGDRRLVCVMGTTTKEHRGSLRQDGASLRPDQVTFLRAMNAADQAVGREPEEDVDGAFAQYRTWAREVEAALGGEARMLGAVPSARPEAAAAAAARLREVEAARKEWRRAAAATTPDQFEEAWDRAAEVVTVESEKALRGAYGLSTEVPQWLRPGPGDKGGGPAKGPSAERV